MGKKHKKNKLKVAEVIRPSHTTEVKRVDISTPDGLIMLDVEYKHEIPAPVALLVSPNQGYRCVIF